MIGRRSFLAGILGAAAAPAIVKAESLMMGRSVTVWKSRSVGPSTTLLYTGELGLIEDFRVVMDPVNQLAADQMMRHTREMLRLMSPGLLQKYSRELGLPSSNGKTIKFRRYGNGAIFVPSTPLHDLLHGDRKTA